MARRRPSARRPVAALLWLGVWLPVSAIAATPPGLRPGAPSLQEVERYELPASDPGLLEAASNTPDAAPTPLRFAVPVPVSLSPGTAGTWFDLAGGSRAWRLRIGAPGARNLNLALGRFAPAPGARVWLYSPDGGTVLGPYTGADRNAAGGLWTPIVPGDELVLELEQPAAGPPTILAVTGVQRGFRDLAPTPAKQGACNVDVACPAGDGWRDQIRAVARISIAGSWLCTGQLVNNTALDDIPYFLTAQHCVTTPDRAPTVVVYWDYQAPACGMLAGGSLAHTQSGASWVASSPWIDGSDFTLLRLDRRPDPTFDVYFAGWDARGFTPSGGVAIHHPQGAVKAISVDENPLEAVDYYGTGPNQWRVGQWELGTTEGGSSGACVFDPASGLCVGTLTTGSASCQLPSGFDIFGRFDAHFDRGGNPGGRLRDWLDPIGAGVLSLPGKNPGAPTTATWVVPAAASLGGVAGADWRSEIVVTNPTASPRTATLRFAAEGEPWPGIPLAGPARIEPGHSLLLDDPLRAVGPAAGLVVVTVDQRGPLVFSRTADHTPGGAVFGQGIPAVPIDDVTPPAELILPLLHSQPGRFRANLGVVHSGAAPLSVRVEIHDGDGSLVASRDLTALGAYRQVNLLAWAGLPDAGITGGWVRVTLIGGPPAWWDAYLSLVDETSGDPTFEPALRPRH